MSGTGLGGAYAGMAQAWADDATLAYAPLARHLVDLTPVPVRGSLALDAGAGSGAAGDVLREGGAVVISADQEPDMAVRAGVAGPAVAADVTALPFRDACFDMVVAAYLVNHLARPEAGLAELRRVTRQGGVVLAAVFSRQQASAKQSVDAVAERHGFVRPQWYDDFKEHADRIGSVAAMEQALRGAGFVSFEVRQTPVDVGLRDPALVVRYRVGMPHLHRFVTELPADQREVFLEEAAAAVRETGAVFAPEIVEAVAVA